MAPEILDVLVFKVGAQSFGVDVEKVVEIVRMPEIFHKEKDGLSECLLIFKDVNIPLIDMAREIYSNYSVSPQDRESVVINIGNRMAAFDIDSVKEFIALPIVSIDTVPDFIHKSIFVDFIWGIGKVEDGVIFLVDFDKFLENADKSALPEIIKR